MLDVEAKLTGNLTEGLDRFETRYKEGVIWAGAAAMAEVMYEEVKANASPPKMGRVTGNLQKSIYRAYIPERSPDGVKTYIVTWRKGPASKNGAPHGHLLEFGTSRTPARPFVRPAFDKIQHAIQVGKERLAQKAAEIG